MLYAHMYLLAMLVRLRTWSRFAQYFWKYTFFTYRKNNIQTQFQSHQVNCLLTIFWLPCGTGCHSTFPWTAVQRLHNTLCQLANETLGQIYAERSIWLVLFLFTKQKFTICHLRYLLSKKQNKQTNKQTQQHNFPFINKHAKITWYNYQPYHL